MMTVAFRTCSISGMLLLVVRMCAVTLTLTNGRRTQYIVRIAQRTSFEVFMQEVLRRDTDMYSIWECYRDSRHMKHARGAPTAGSLKYVLDIQRTSICVNGTWSGTRLRRRPESPACNGSAILFGIITDTTLRCINCCTNCRIHRHYQSVCTRKYGHTVRMEQHEKLPTQKWVPRRTMASVRNN